jgi:hypothetical protein
MILVVNPIIAVSEGDDTRPQQRGDHRDNLEQDLSAPHTLMVLIIMGFGFSISGECHDIHHGLRLSRSV